MSAGPCWGRGRLCGSILDFCLIGIRYSVSVDLSTALTVDSLQAMLSNPAVVQELQQHLPPLDETGNHQEQLRATLASPQFQQVSRFDSTMMLHRHAGALHENIFRLSFSMSLGVRVKVYLDFSYTFHTLVLI